jgi:hypothetical protein
VFVNGSLNHVLGNSVYEITVTDAGTMRHTVTRMKGKWDQ